MSRAGGWLFGATTAPAAAAGHYKPFSIPSEVVDEFPGFRFIDDRANRHRHSPRLAAASCLVRDFAVPPPFRFVLGIEAQVQEGVVVLAGHQDNVPAAASIAAVRPAFRDELLAAKRQAAIAAVSGNDVNLDFVYEHKKRPPAPRQATAPLMAR